jgi:hypothetical protein
MSHAVRLSKDGMKKAKFYLDWKEVLDIAEEIATNLYVFNNNWPEYKIRFKK